MPQKSPEAEAVSPENMAKTMAEVMARSQQLLSKFMLRHAGNLGAGFDLAQLGEQFYKNMAQASFDPQILIVSLRRLCFFAGIVSKLVADRRCLGLGSRLLRVSNCRTDPERRTKQH